MCFDKTGTLTEEGLDVYGVRSVCYEKSSFYPIITPVIIIIVLMKCIDSKKLSFRQLCGDVRFFSQLIANAKAKSNELSTEGNSQKSSMTTDELLLNILATCHSLTVIGKDLYGKQMTIAITLF